VELQAEGILPPDLKVSCRVLVGVTPAEIIRIGMAYNESGRTTAGGTIFEDLIVRFLQLFLFVVLLMNAAPPPVDEQHNFAEVH